MRYFLGHPLPLKIKPPKKEHVSLVYSWDIPPSMVFFLVFLHIKKVVPSKKTTPASFCALFGTTAKEWSWVFFRNTVSPQTWSSKLFLWDAFKQNPTKVMSRTLNPGDRNGKTRSQSSQTSPQRAPHMFAAQKGTKENLWHPRMSPFKPSHKEGTLIHPPLGACGLYRRQCLFLGFPEKKEEKKEHGSCPGLTSTPVYQ